MSAAVYDPDCGEWSQAVTGNFIFNSTISPSIYLEKEKLPPAAIKHSSFSEPCLNSIKLRRCACQLPGSPRLSGVRKNSLNAIKGFMSAGLFSTVPMELYKLAITLQGGFTSAITGLAAVSPYALPIPEISIKTQGWPIEYCRHTAGCGVQKSYKSK